jgi:hypothetical protein
MHQLLRGRQNAARIDATNAWTNRLIAGAAAPTGDTSDEPVQTPELITPVGKDGQTASL